MLSIIVNISFSLIVSAGQKISGLAVLVQGLQGGTCQCQPGLQSSEGLPGAGGAASKVPLSRDWQVDDGCHWKPLFPSSPQHYLSVLPTWQLSSPRTSDPEREGGNGDDFCGNLGNSTLSLP